MPIASIDKIYGTNQQYDEFKAWAKINNRSLLQYFYPRYGYINKNDRPITNFPKNVDEWLLSHCNLKWVIDRIQKQYNLDKNKTAIKK